MNAYPSTHFCAAGKRVFRDYDWSTAGTVLDQSRGAGEVLVQFDGEAEPMWCYPHDLEPA